MNKENVNEDELEVRESAIEQIAGHTRKNGLTHYIVRCYRHTCSNDTVEPPENFLDQIIERYCRQIAEGQIAANAWGSMKRYMDQKWVYHIMSENNSRSRQRLETKDDWPPAHELLGRSVT